MNKTKGVNHLPMLLWLGVKSPARKCGSRLRNCLFEVSCKDIMMTLTTKVVVIEMAMLIMIIMVRGAIIKQKLSFTLRMWGNEIMMTVMMMMMMIIIIMMIILH